MPQRSTPPVRPALPERPVPPPSARGRGGPPVAGIPGAGAERRWAGRSYARARLWLGIAGVGSQVVLAVVALALDLPGRHLPTDPRLGVGAMLLALLPALLVPVLLLLPLDVLGGMVVVREPVRPGRWLAGWARGAAVQLAAWLVAAAATVAAARAGGAPAVLAAVALLQGALLAGRGALAALVAPLRPVPEGTPVARRLREAARAAGLDPAVVRPVDAPDPGFVGGWTGLGGRTLVVPARWAALPQATRVAQLARRRALRTGGAGGLHGRGVLLGAAWTLLGVALALWGAGVSATSAAGVATLWALLVPWNFLGLLLLPTPSRAGVHAADLAAARAVGEAPVRGAVTQLDRWQDDEPARPAGVEAIFHPVPSRGRRLAALASAATGGASPAGPFAPRWWAAHLAARHALYLAWAVGSPLSRAVHCNVGRPGVWVLWPGD